MLEFLQVQKSYGPHRILSIPERRLSPGTWWLQGPNGSGKTTLLRMIAGLLPFKGDIHLDGHSIRRDPISYRRAVSWADAAPQYPAFLTGKDLISFYCSVRKPQSSQAQHLLSVFSMQSYIATRTDAWSDGMIKKLSLVLAFIGQPALIVLDEPLVTLDMTSVSLLYHMIRDRRAQGCSFLLTSHQEVDQDHLPVDLKLLIRDQTLEIPEAL
jgi:ABC-2 type transport system ATP-binding protein